jgi:hypothetical protein
MVINLELDPILISFSSYLFRSQDSDAEHYAEAVWGTQSPKRMHMYGKSISNNHNN